MAGWNCGAACASQLVEATMILPDKNATILRDEVRRAGQRIDGWRCLLYGYIAVPLIVVTAFLLMAHGADLASPGFVFMATWLGSGVAALASPSPTGGGSEVAFAGRCP